MKKNYKKYFISLSMGHDTDIRDMKFEVKARDKTEAYHLAWTSLWYRTPDMPDKIREIWRKKGLNYNPYFYFYDNEK